MANYKLPTESVFLRELAVREFNFQYKRNIDPALCTIKSIAAGYGCSHGYEITTNQTDDHLRLRLYFTLAEMDSFLPYRLETDSSMIQGELGDEIYVTIGTINQYYIDSGTYRFRTMTTSSGSTVLVHYMDGLAMTFMDGTNVEYVAAV